MLDVKWSAFLELIVSDIFGEQAVKGSSIPTEK